MTSGEHERHRRTLPFFRSPPAWVLIREDEAGELRVATEKTDQGQAILCFLSPLDAMIDVERFARLGRTFGVMPTMSLDGNLFRDADGQGLIVSLHAGWLASGSRIMVRPSGALCRYTTDMHVWADEPAFFEVLPQTLDIFDQLYEAAGLFAWRETYLVLQGWDGMRLREMARQAIEAIPAVGGGPDDCTGFALFDPEFMQWHLVPREFIQNTVE